MKSRTCTMGEVSMPSDARRLRAAGTTLAGWGMVPTVPGAELRSEDLASLTGDRPRLARGLGRAYGDAALPAYDDFHVSGTTLADRVLAFDEASGLLRAEAGLSLERMNALFLPRGFFTPVSPGTSFVTLGGMVACDVHGKNHHRAGCFGAHVRSLLIRVASGDVVRCSPTIESDLFRATIGGMGLTGAILEIEVQMQRVSSPWIHEERETVGDVGAMIERLRSAAGQWPMTVAWIDCLSRGRAAGRGVLMKGRWATPQEAPTRYPAAKRGLSIPFELPGFVLSPPAVRVFNAIHYWSHAGTRRGSIVHPYSFFYPLDAIQNWRRLYGRRGFVQYQCVVPDPDVVAPARKIVDLVMRGGSTSFLCVVKDCGPEGEGLLSFPKPGISIALDIPRRADTQQLIDALNEVVLAAGGRIYLAKDALTRREHFNAMETRLPRFLETRRRWDPQGLIRSAQSVRLFGW